MIPMNRTAAAAGLFALYLWFLGAGGLWVAASFLPEGIPRDVVIAVLGVCFAAAFLWLLSTRLMRLFGGHGSAAWELSLAAANLGLLILAFASIYAQIGIVNDSLPDQPRSHDFWTAAYYSVVTFTTLGYGDFRPVGIARFVACVEALTGYLVLAILASTIAECSNSTAGTGPNGMATNGGRPPIPIRDDAESR